MRNDRIIMNNLEAGILVMLYVNVLRKSMKSVRILSLQAEICTVKRG
jgi:hypothetical protein